MNEGNEEEEDELASISKPTQPELPGPSTSSTPAPSSSRPEPSFTQPDPDQSTANIGFTPFPSNTNNEFDSCCAH